MLPPKRVDLYPLPTHIFKAFILMVNILGCKLKSSVISLVDGSFLELNSLTHEGIQKRSVALTSFRVVTAVDVVVEQF